MGHHLTELGEFKSDKYPWCPEGFFPLKLTDPIAQRCILMYAGALFFEPGDSDTELAEDLRAAVTRQRAKQAEQEGS